MRLGQMRRRSNVREYLCRNDHFLNVLLFCTLKRSYFTPASPHFADNRAQRTRVGTAVPPATSAWPPADRLSEYVTETCLVDYGRLAAQESEWLHPVLTSVKKTSPNTEADRHAFLINAYNLWTMYWVIRERRYSSMCFLSVAAARRQPPAFAVQMVWVCVSRT